MLDSGHYILSDEVDRFESAFATACAASHAVGVASGTDAITIALLAAGVGPGDEVITAPNTCIPTIVGIERAGATPVLADVDPATYTLDPAEVERRLTPRTKAILPVHLYGQPADIEALLALGEAHGVDRGRGLRPGARRHGRRRAGGLVRRGVRVQLLSDEEPRRARGRGRGRHPVGRDRRRAPACSATTASGSGSSTSCAGSTAGSTRSRRPCSPSSSADLDAGVERRRRLAAVYDEALAGTQLTAPATVAGRDHAYHLYVVQAPDRDRFRAALDEAGIGTAVHYPTPVHRQPAYRDLDVPGGFPVAESLCERW